MQLKELLREFSYLDIPENCEINAITYDSRKVKPGTLFIAIKGSTVLGNQLSRHAIRSISIIKIKDSVNLSNNDKESNLDEQKSISDEINQEDNSQIKMNF